MKKRTVDGQVRDVKAQLGLALMIVGMQMLGESKVLKKKGNRRAR